MIEINNDDNKIITCNSLITRIGQGDKLIPILSVPYAGTEIHWRDRKNIFLPYIPVGSLLAAQFNLTNKKKLRAKVKAIEDEECVLTSWYTDELFDNGLFPLVKTKISRLVCDVERIPDDDKRKDTKYCGVGFCFSRGTYSQEIKNVTHEYKAEVLWKYYAPYHNALFNEVNESLKFHNRALIISCHSLPDFPQPYENDNLKHIPRSDIYLGIDKFHTSENLVNITKKFFKGKGYSVCIYNLINECIVPVQVFHIDKRVEAISIDVNFKLYMEKSQRLEDFKILKENLTEYENSVLNYLYEQKR